MGIKISKKKFVAYIKNEKKIWDLKISNSDINSWLEMTGLSEEELFYIWRHYGTLTVKYIGDGEYGEHPQ